MSALSKLADCAGSWSGVNHLQDPHSNLDDESPGTATVTPILGGRFIRFAYTWVYQGQPQEGVMLVGFDAGVVTAHWIDSWHMGTKVMACTGQADADGNLSVRGSYAAPPGPDWGWRTDIFPSTDALRLVMYNIWPEGKEDVAVEASYRRVD